MKGLGKDERRNASEPLQPSLREISEKTSIHLGQKARNRDMVFRPNHTQPIRSRRIWWTLSHHQLYSKRKLVSPTRSLQEKEEQSSKVGRSQDPTTTEGVKDDGKSEGPIVMIGIAVQTLPYCESKPTSIRYIMTRNLQETSKSDKR